MSREIKYRVKVTWCDSVWLADVDSMKSDGFGGWYGLAFINVNGWESAQVEFNTEAGDVLMQYTGINDKDGIEIYGGDTVMRTSTLPGSSDFVGVVEMLEGCWVIHHEDGAEKLWTECDINEVIGNIYENPELLEAINEQGND